MHKCNKCGREYEGVFCPDCGEPFEKICPQCGKKAEDNARFCNSCGYSFDARQNTISAAQPDVRKVAESIATNKILAVFLKYAACGLFCILSLLMFAFYAAPVDVDPLGLGLSNGNLYGRAFCMFTGKISEYMQDGINIGVMYVYMFLGLLPIVGVIYIFVIACMALTGNKHIKKMETGTLFYTLIYVALGIYIIIDVQNSGMKVGAAPILMVAFASVFFVLEIIALICRKNFYRNHPEYDVLS